MRKSYVRLILIVIFLFSVGIRLYFGLQTSYFNDDSSYFILRQIEHITVHKVPLFDDSLSYSGRTLIFSPVFHYLMALFSFLMPLSLALKIIPNILASSMVFIVYAISYNITRRTYLSLFTALVSVFIPIYVSQTYNTLTPLSIVLPLTFYCVYLLLNVRKNDRYIYGFIITLVLLSLLSPLSILLVTGALIYLLLCKLTGIKNDKIEKELITFSTFYVVWLQFVLYKNAFLQHGAGVIWQNLPSKFLSTHFSQFSLPEAIYQIGFFLFLCGIYVIYSNIFSERNKKIYFFFGFAISTIILLWFKLIPYVVGLIFLGFVLVVLFAYFLVMFFNFTEKVHLTQFNLLFVFIIGVFLLFGSFLPTLIETYVSHTTSHSDQDIDTFNWVRTLPEGSVILVPVEQGHLLTFFGSQKNVMDTNFLLVDDVNERLASVNEIYQTSFTNNAIRLLNKYNVDYLILTDYAKEIYGIEELKYLDDNCFKEVHPGVYQSLCSIQEK
jgi:hypothetical protein